MKKKNKQETRHEMRIPERDIFLFTTTSYTYNLHSECELPCSNNITDKLGVQKLLVGSLRLPIPYHLPGKVTGVGLV